MGDKSVMNDLMRVPDLQPNDVPTNIIDTNCWLSLSITISITHLQRKHDTVRVLVVVAVAAAAAAVVVAVRKLSRL